MNVAIRVEESSAAQHHLLEKDGAIDILQNALELVHLVYRNARVIAFERSEEVKIWTLTKLLVDLLRRESFVGEDDPLAEVVVDDKGAVGRSVDGVAWKDLSANWLHAFEIVGVDHGDVATAFDASLAGEC